MKKQKTIFIVDKNNSKKNVLFEVNTKACVAISAYWKWILKYLVY